MLKRLARTALGAFGLRVSRGPRNRFDATADALAHLRRRGLRPPVILDAGANRGQWARTALRVFPEARVLLIEPQPACRAALAALCAQLPAARLAAVAVTAPGVRELWMPAVAATVGSTGAQVRPPGGERGDAVAVPARTLDEVAAEAFDDDALDGALLKLDLEGHEVEALRGATCVLGRAAVVWTETRLLGRDAAEGTDLAAVTATLGEHGFTLYDVASLSGRPADGRLRILDLVFVRLGGSLDRERRWDLRGPPVP